MFKCKVLVEGGEGAEGRMLGSGGIAPESGLIAVGHGGAWNKVRLGQDLGRVWFYFYG